MLRLLLLIFGGLVVLLAAAHRVTLIWEDTQNPAGTKYNVYRATGDCPQASSDFVKIGSLIDAKTYDDTPVNPGTYCYFVTAVDADMESLPSNNAGATVKSFPPTGLTVQVQ